MSSEPITIPMEMSVNNKIIPATMTSGSNVKYFHLWNSILTRSVTEITDDVVPEDLLSIPDNLFQNNLNLSTVNLENVQHIGAETFYNCGITEINMPSLIDTGTRAFAYNPISDVSLPALTSVATYMFMGCQNLERADFQNVEILRSSCFSGCQSLATLILRKNQFVALEGRNHFESTPIAEGTGLIYVQADLIETYQASPMWATIPNSSGHCPNWSNNSK